MEGVFLSYFLSVMSHLKHKYLWFLMEGVFQTCSAHFLGNSEFPLFPTEN